jgi:peptidoglycan hydrolase-like protein with peptidoglycan-binding domain
VLGGAAAWAALTAFAPPAEVSDEAPFTLVEVASGEVGASINLNSVAAWTPVPIGSNLAAGTVTSVSATSGEEVNAGTSLYTVNLRPVVIAEGDVPAFRELSEGAKGSDVAQLQSLLKNLGFYTAGVDGSFGWGTRKAVQKWQAAVGVDDDGVVQAGDVLFVPHLPTRILVDTSIVVRGNTLSGGEAAVLGIPASPQFTVPVSDAQSGTIPDGTQVEITGPNDEAWIGFVIDRKKQEQSETIDLMLSGKDDAPICLETCGGISVTTPTQLSSRVITVETVTGLVVPSAALLSKTDGSVVVIDEGGEEHPVEVLASARGMSAIQGVEAGLRVRLPAGPQ